MMTQKNDKSTKRIETLIDDNLKRIYSDLVEEDLPDRFKDLLAQLKEQDSEDGSTK